MPDYSVPQFESMRLEIACLQRTVAEQQAEIERLRCLISDLREVSLRRFISCMTSGAMSQDNAQYIPQQWNWSCALCGASSVNDQCECNLSHLADCPIVWIEALEAAKAAGGDAPAKPTPPSIELVKDGFFKTTVRKAGGDDE